MKKVFQVHPVSYIFATYVGINTTFLHEINVGINWHKQTPDRIVLLLFPLLYTVFAWV